MAKMSVKTDKNDILSQKTASNQFLSSYFAQMDLKIALLTTFFTFSCAALFSQASAPASDIQQTIQTLIEDFTEFNNGGEDFDFNTLYEELLTFYNDKLDINKADEATLSQLVFLSDADVQNIISYRGTYGDFITIYELQSVPGLTFDKLNSLRLFVTVSAPKTSNQDLRITSLENQNNNIYFKWRYNIETARGFQSVNGAEPKFIGDKNHLYLRYNHNSSTERYGLIIEKDAGELLINQYAETGLDYLSLHYQKKDVSPWIRQINIGDYNISMGQGLVAHSAFGTGKSSLSTSIKKGRQGIRAYNSVAENLAFRGVALDIAPQSNAWQSILFASYIPRDANLLQDTLPVTEFSSLPLGGLHRTTGERSDQDGVYELTVGCATDVKVYDNLELGFNLIHHSFDKSFASRLQPYQIFRWQGDRLTNMSVDYNALLGGWNLYGEVARSSTNGWAHMHGLVKTLDPSFDVAMVYRDYGQRYQSLYANAFGESTSANNERGLYIGFEYRPAKKWSIRGFVDNWKNDWLRFRVDGPSSGKEYLLRLDYKERRKRHLYLQYRYEVKDENSNEDLLIDIPVARKIQRLRLHASHQIGNGIELRSRIEGSLYHKENETEKGILIYQDIISRKLESPLMVSARVAYFNISDFDARIYTYENDLLFEYFIPSFSGHGFRYYALARYNLSRSIMAEVRWEQTNFFGADFVSSNDNLIEGSTISRVKAQVRWRF